MAKLVWTEPALTYLEAIHAYVRKDSPTYARRMRDRLRLAPKQLKRHPFLGTRLAEFGEIEVREIIVAPYRIMSARTCVPSSRSFTGAAMFGFEANPSEAT